MRAPGRVSYLVGWNVVGAELMDEPVRHGTWVGAVRCLADQLNRAADGVDVDAWYDEYHQARDDLWAAVRGDPSPIPPGWTGSILFEDERVSHWIQEVQQ